MTRRLHACAAALALSAAACEGAPTARAQLVVYVDTDAPVPAQAKADPTISGDATIDTLRVDGLGDAGTPYDFNQFTLTEPGDLPISFGVAAPSDGAIVRLRLRLFASAFAGAGLVDGRPSLEPQVGLAIERLVDLPPPSSGVQSVLVTLHGDCWGIPTSYVDPVTTCIDASTPAGAPAADLTEPSTTPPHSDVGTWVLAHEVPCTTDGDKICIPGGVTVLGDPAFVGVADVDRLDSVPFRAALLAPFLLDRTEVTTAEYAALVASGAYAGDPPAAQGASTPSCTYRGPTDPGSSLPLNCVTWAVAEAICDARGGRLPSEARWEHAARGRGERLMYPWGTAPAACCMTSASRAGDTSVADECAIEGSGLEVADSHAPSAACGGYGDASRDGVADLGGSLAEAVADSFASFTASCWSTPGLPLNPTCADPSTTEHVARGGSWSGSLADTRAPLRSLFLEGDASSGFRCAYDP